MCKKLYFNGVIIVAKSRTAIYPVNSQSKRPFSREKIFPDYYSSYQCKIALGTKDCLPK